jgi:hypothetical protein
VTESISDLSGAGFTMDYKASTGVDATIKWTCQGGNLTALDAGTSGGLSVSTSNVQIKSDSVKVTGYNLPASFGPGSTWTITESVDATASAAGKSVDSQLAYTLNCSYGDAESVTVPAGTFSALKANCTKDSTMSAVVSGKSMQLNDTKENVTYWYVKGVGQVKTVYSGGKDDQTVVLEKYTVN